MDDDFNTAGALSHLFELVRAINLARDAAVVPESLQQAQDRLKMLAGVLGFRLEAEAHSHLVAAPFIELLLELREALRRAKQWALADQIRDRLGELGVVLEDGKEGSAWHMR